MTPAERLMARTLLTRRTLGRAAAADPRTLATALAAHADGRHGTDARTWAGVCPACAERSCCVCGKVATVEDTAYGEAYCGRCADTYEVWDGPTRPLGNEG
jgi:hypothetical protein